MSSVFISAFAFEKGIWFPGSHTSRLFFIYPFEKVQAQNKTEFRENEFIGVSTENFRKLKFSSLRHLKEKLVLQQTVSFHNKKDYNAHRLLRCIGENILLSQLPESQQGKMSDVMVSQKKLETVFEDSQKEDVETLKGFVLKN